MGSGRIATGKTARLAPWLVLLAACGCGDDRLTLRYEFDPEDVPGAAVATLQTHLAPTEPQRFVATVDDQLLEDGVHYSIACPGTPTDGCAPEMIIEHDAALGFHFSDDFVLRFAPNPAGAPARIVVSAIARDAAGASIAHAAQVESAFAGATLEIVLHERTRCGAVLCAEGALCCDDRCVDPGTDVASCGACDSPCGDGEVCSAGACRCGAQPGCRDKACCGGTTCADLQGDPKNCGTCGTACGMGEACVAGACVCGTSGAACDPMQTCCGADDGCVSGGMTCSCKGQSCQAGEICCDSGCANVEGSDDGNCGQCGLSCGTGPTALSCDKGVCGCGGQSCGVECCGGASCVDLQSDEANCGACGQKCGLGETCNLGRCYCGTTVNGCTSPGSLCCNGACTAPKDTQNCGACGTVCNLHETCDSGKCGCPNNGDNRCASGSTCCPASVCPQTASDNDNCGGCGVPCHATGFSCVAGMCVQTSCSGPCGTGETCQGTTCKCGGGPSCGNGTTCCNGTCTNLSNDDLHCGNCGTPCVNGNTCSNSTCGCGGGPPCAGGATCVGGVCGLMLGSSCTSGEMCASGICSGDGSCCSTPCPGPCRGCSSGTCIGVGSGSRDPTNLCSDDGSDCGQTGYCAGAGSCQYRSSGLPCCSGPNQHGTCNGLGACQGSFACPDGCVAGACNP